MIRTRGKDMLFIEAHGHCWNELHGRRFDTKKLLPLDYGKVSIGGEEMQFVLPENRDSRVTFEVLEAYQNLLGFDKVVILQTPCYGEQYEYINDIIAKHPGKYVTVGLANPQDKKAFIEEAALCLDTYKYKGLKFESPDTPFDMVAPENQFVFEEIMKRDAFFMLDMGWFDEPNNFLIDDLTEVARRYPTMKIIIPHLGISKMFDPVHAEKLDCLKRVYDLVSVNENVYYDCSGIPMLAERAGQKYPWPVISNALKLGKEMGVIDRIMWGSDAPCLLLTCTYQQQVDCIVDHCDFLTDDEMENLLGKTANRVWFDCE